MKPFSSRLKALRKQRQLNQKALAKQLNLSQTTIANYENDQRNPSLELLIQLANFFNVTIDYLLGHENVTNQPITPYPEKAATFYQLLKERNIKKSVNYLRTLTKQMALEQLYEHVIIYTLHRIGNEWQQGHLTVVDEHILSNRIQQVLSSLLLTVNTNNKKTVNGNILTLTPKNEQHTIVTQILHNCLTAEGFNSVSIPGNLSAFHLKEALGQLKPKIIIISLTMKNYLSEVNELINTINAYDTTIKTIVGGRPFDEEKNLWKRVNADGYAKRIDTTIGLVKQWRGFYE